MPDKAAAAVLLVDPDPEVGRAILGYLSDRDYVVEWVDNGEKAFNRLDRHAFDVLVTELNVPRVDGMRLMSVGRERNPEICVVFIAEYGDIALATEAMRRGAYDFQIKPVNLGKLEAVLERGIDYQRLVYRQHELRRRLDESFGLGSLVGNSRQMVRVYTAVRAAAPSDAPVLIRGEAGTGKDLIAQAIHNNSGRRDEAFVKVECAGGPPERLDRELFGAGGQPGQPGQPGRIERADRGTLYLDEAGELTAAQQQAVANLIEKNQTRRLGGGRGIAVDVRVIASTSNPAGALDAKLGPLLKAVIDAPALRERPEDVALLVHHILRETSQVHGWPVGGITANALDVLTRFDWPGNVRELKNVVEGMAATLRGAHAVDVGNIPLYVRQAAGATAKEIRVPLGATMAEAERMIIEETLKSTGNSKEQCARILDIGLRTLYRRLTEYGLH